MRILPIVLLIVAVAACGDDPSKASVDPESQTTLAVKSYIDDQLVTLHDAAVTLQSKAPETGWSKDTHLAEVTALRTAWADTRSAYERIEGAIAVLFEDLDYSTDARYEMFLEEGADTNLYDDHIVIGMHGIERILWATDIPAYVTNFEVGIEGYQAPAYPTEDSAATSFKTELTQKLVDDLAQMIATFDPLALDPGAAYRGVIGSMAEQFEKVNLGATGEDESRYAQHTLGDMRANLAGGREIYASFSDWLRGKPDGAELDDAIKQSFDTVSAYYDTLSGDALPELPADWNPDSPSDATDYGKLFIFLSEQSDEENSDSLVARMRAGAELLGIAVDQ